MTPPFKPLPDHLNYPAGSPGAVLQVAASQVGYREGASNDNAFGAWYGVNFVPWCAQYVSWAAWQGAVPQSIIPKHAYTPAGAAWFRARGQLYSTPKAGDLAYVYYSGLGRIGHVFLVESVRIVGGATVMSTLEGNTNDTGSSQGNGVYRLTRGDTTNLSYGRPAYSFQEDDMPLNATDLNNIRAIVRREATDAASRALQAWIGGGTNQEFDPTEIAQIKAIGARGGVLGDLFTGAKSDGDPEGEPDD